MIDFHYTMRTQDLGGSFLDDSSLCAVLSSHRCPIRRFSVISDSRRTLPAWVGALLARKTTIDSVTLKLGNEQFKPQLPLAANVRRLELRFCCVDLLPSSLFPVLECLRLAWVEISETGLAGLVDGGCPALRELRLESMHDGLRRVTLRSRTLATACISSCWNLEELCVRDTPSLRALTSHLPVHGPVADKTRGSRLRPRDWPHAAHHRLTRRTTSRYGYAVALGDIA
ncbi:hypothetical protein EJB05_04514, partial [Eragrostis curvula]